MSAYGQGVNNYSAHSVIMAAVSGSAAERDLQTEIYGDEEGPVGSSLHLDIY